MTPKRFALSHSKSHFIGLGATVPGPSQASGPDNFNVTVGQGLPPELATPFRQQNSGSNRVSSSKRQRLSERVQSCPPKQEQGSISSKSVKAKLVLGPLSSRSATFALPGKEAHAGKAEFLAEELSRLSIALCGLCESRWPGQGQKVVGAYSVHYSGGTTRHHGVALALSQAASQSLQGCSPISDRIITATFHTALTPLTVI